MLTVKAPKGVRVTLACAGRGCPLREVSQTTSRGKSALHIPQFERELRAGTQLTITVAKPGYISKVTRVTIRRGKAPARSDQCRCRTPRSSRAALADGAHRLVRFVSSADRRGRSPGQ